jgi:hypothetical protein
MWWHCHRATDTRNWREHSALANQVPRTQHTQFVHRLFWWTLYLQSRFEIEVPGHICFSVGKWWGNNFCPNLCQLLYSLRWSNFWAWEIYQKSVQNPWCKQLQCLACLKSANAIACLLAKGKKRRNQSTHTLVLENTSILIWGRVLDLHANLSAIDAVMNDTDLKKSLSNIQHTEWYLYQTGKALYTSNTRSWRRHTFLSGW